MQTNDQGPPSTAQEKPSEAAGGSVREALAALVFEIDPIKRKQIIENYCRGFSRQLAETRARCIEMLRRGSANG